MVQRVREMIDKTPTPMGQIIKFACLTGLRPSEAIESVNLLITASGPKQYYNEERQALEHFRFPEIFFRQTKKAYISFMAPDMIEGVRYIEQLPTYNAIRLACRKRGINMDMRYCRKIFASHLRQSGIESEIVDLLQGRVPRTVFARHYFTPSLDYRQKVLQGLDKLRKDIEL
jgi:intergrase/recombinase